MASLPELNPEIVVKALERIASGLADKNFTVMTESARNLLEYLETRQGGYIDAE